VVKKRPVLTDKKLKYDEIKKIIKFHKLFQMKQTVIKKWGSNLTGGKIGG
jgi:hypothetical protein